MDITLNQKLIELTRKKKAIEAELDDLKNEIAQVREAVGRQFVEEGTQNWRGSDGAMICLRRNLFAKLKYGVDPDQAFKAMNESGLDFLVKTKVDTHGLASWVREREEECEGDGPVTYESMLPESVRGLFDFSEQITPAVLGT